MSWSESGEYGTATKVLRSSPPSNLCELAPGSDAGDKRHFGCGFCGATWPGLAWHLAGAAAAVPVPVPVAVAVSVAAAFVCFAADYSDFALDHAFFCVLAPAAPIRALAVVLVVAAGGVADVDVPVDGVVHQNL